MGNSLIEGLANKASGNYDVGYGLKAKDVADHLGVPLEVVGTLDDKVLQNIMVQKENKNIQDWAAADSMIAANRKYIADKADAAAMFGTTPNKIVGHPYEQNIDQNIANAFRQYRTGGTGVLKPIPNLRMK